MGRRSAFEHDKIFACSSSHVVNTALEGSKSFLTSYGNIRILTTVMPQLLVVNANTAIAPFNVTGGAVFAPLAASITTHMGYSCGFFTVAGPQSCPAP